jgi:1-aminocyclopropane-1-carboxylate deaminase
MDKNFPSLLEPVHLLESAPKNISTDVLRLDKLHPIVSGNKWFKLKGHLQKALELREDSASASAFDSASASASAYPVITFGGAWSNHLIATAYATKQSGLAAIGIVRGERPEKLSSTLTAAVAFGMHLEFVSRGEYDAKAGPASFSQLTNRYPGAYIIPEGGGGMTGILGSEDILRMEDTGKYTHILCAIGTGTMFLGLARVALAGQQVIGIPVLKNTPPEIFEPDPGILSPAQRARCHILPGYHFGGYARHPRELLNFMNNFHRQTGTPTDIVYTGKLFYATLDSIRQGFFPDRSRLLIIHSGGLQGNQSLPPGTLDF